MMVLLACAGPSVLPARSNAQGVPPGVQGPAAPNPGADQDVILDRVAAIVNGDLILESDVDSERRFQAFQAVASARLVTRDQLISRLIDRQLILQQIALHPEPPVSDADLDEALALERKTIPQCAAYHCDTDTGWEKFLADQGFTRQEVRDRWRTRMEVLRFIEERFRMGIRITQQEIDDYYKNTLLPAYAKQNAQAPPEDSLADRIREILLQQQVDKLLDDWLTALRAQGTVRILKPGEEAP